MLSEKPMTFSEMLKDIQLSSSHLTYHLESLGELVSKTDEGTYKLSAFGEVAVGTVKKVEETPRATESKRLPSLSIKWKSLTVTLLIGLVVLAGLAYTQYQSLNRLSQDYGQLTKLIDSLEKDPAIQYEYELRYNSSTIHGSAIGVPLSVIETLPEQLNSSTIVPPPENVSLTTLDIYFIPPENLSLTTLNVSSSTLMFSGPWCCAIYTSYDNCTLHLTLQMHSISSGLHMPLTVQKGSTFDVETDEIAPVIWSANATMTGEYSILLLSKGWYTISLVGPITTISRYMIPFIDSADCSTLLSITQQGTNLPFIVMANDPL